MRAFRWRERERERERHGVSFYYFNQDGSKIIYIFFNLALMNSAHLSIDVHCSNGAKKKKDFAPLLHVSFWCFGGAKIVI